VVVAGLVFVNAKIAPTATGYYSKIMCSSVFVSGLDPDRVVDEDLAPYWYVRASVDREAETVTARLMGMAPRTAVYREGLGCTLAIDVDEDTLRGQVPSLAQWPSAPSDAAWPVGDTLDDAPIEGIDYAALEAALDYGFAEPDPDKPILTRAIVVLYGERLVAERYAAGIDAQTPLLGWSMAKSVGATLVGVLVHRGLLDLHAPAPIPAWKQAGDPRAALSLDQLMRMSSGLEFEEVYGPLSEATTMLFESYDAASVAMAKPLAAEPDTVWSYSSGTSNLIAWVVRQTVEALPADPAHPERGTSWRRYLSFPRAALFEPIGMHSAVVEPDPSGTFVSSSFMYASTRDWARFGLLHLRDGVWEGERLLPEGWVEYVSTATPMAPMGEYGAQWWTNDGKPGDPSERRFPSAPPDLFQASGFQGQAVIVIPSRDVVIVRMGLAHSRDALDLDGLVAQVLEALPEDAD